MSDKMIFKSFLVFIYIFCVSGDVFGVTDELIVKTSSGTVKGLNINVFNHSINQFLGIPYAEPPLGSLRFAKPKPISKPIEDVIDATKTKSSCIQPKLAVIGPFPTSEDCLFLNIWSPKGSVNNSTKLKPVMFWIHGGGLRSGSIFFLNVYTGHILATHDVVVVSVNYRFGSLGFLYGGGDSAPGNVGFYDQVLGLTWVKENIHLFGGDKNKITIFGESAGSWSVSAHIISPLSEGLFERAILQSGAHLYNKDIPLYSKELALSNAKQLAKRVNCTDDKQWLQCLRKVDANQILSHSGDLPHYPVDGTQFLPNSAQKALIKPKDIDLMAGITRNEGSNLATTNYPVVSSNLTENLFEALTLKTSLVYHFNKRTNVTKHYLDNINKTDGKALRKAFFEFYGDLVIKCPTYQMAKQFARSAPKRKTYFYEFNFIDSFIPLYLCDMSTMGICHGADLEFVFGLPLFNKHLKYDFSVQFSRYVMKMWTNFAKTGEPGEDWILPLNHHGHSITKLLDPNHPGAFYVDRFKDSCDGLWNNYFQ